MLKHTLSRTGLVPVIGGEIHYRAYEPHNAEKAKRTPILFLHGGPGASHAIMYDSLSELADERPCLFYDQLGSFYSPAQLEPAHRTVERFADEITRLLKALEMGKVILFGHSWGGGLAVYYALHHPDAVESLILSCPLLSTQRWIEDCQSLLRALPTDSQETIIRCEADGTTDSAAYKAADSLFSSRHYLRMNPPPDIWLKHKNKTNRALYKAMWGPSEFSCSGTLKNFDLFPDLHKIAVPTTFLCGEHDTATPQTLREAQSLLSGSRVVVIPDSGHLAFIDGHDAYVKAVLEHLNQSL